MTYLCKYVMISYGDFMSNFEEKEMYLYDSETSSEPFSNLVVNIPSSFDGYVFSKICRDTIGLSSTNPTWGDLYRYTNHELYYIGICIYKEMDYDIPNAPYSEKMWSLLGKRVLKNCLIPNITLIKDQKNKETGLLSHIILDNSLEDLTLMNNLLFYKFERQDLSKLHSVIPIQDLLECVKIQINNEQNYIEVESQIIQTLLLDSITNNSDRHSNNWGLVRNKESNHYTLGLFDHSSSFIDMISEKKTSTIDGWTSTYSSVTSQPKRSGIGDFGNNIVTYLCNNYPNICKQFMHNLNLELENFYEDISSAPYYIDKRRLQRNISHKSIFIDKLLKQIEQDDKGGR